jgi:hypothetical protein
VSIAEKVFYTLLSFPKELPISFRYYSNILKDLLGAFPNMPRHKFKKFLYISLEVGCFCFIEIKN